MKKVITICLLIVALLTGGMIAEAKTTKKKSKAKTQQVLHSSNRFGLMSFIEKYYRYWNLKSEEKIIQSLYKSGFTKKPLNTQKTTVPIFLDENGKLVTPKGMWDDAIGSHCTGCERFVKDNTNVYILYSANFPHGVPGSPFFDSLIVVFPSVDDFENFISDAKKIGFKKIEDDEYILCKDICININVIGQRTIQMTQDEA